LLVGVLVGVLVDRLIEPNLVSSWKFVQVEAVAVAATTIKF